MSKGKRYIISIVRLFLTTFISTLILQLQYMGELSTKTLASLFLGVLIATMTTVVKYIQEHKLIEKLINKIIK